MTYLFHNEFAKINVTVLLRYVLGIHYLYTHRYTNKYNRNKRNSDIVSCNKIFHNHHFTNFRDELHSPFICQAIPFARSRTIQSCQTLKETRFPSSVREIRKRSLCSISLGKVQFDVDRREITKLDWLQMHSVTDITVNEFNS